MLGANPPNQTNSASKHDENFLELAHELRSNLNLIRHWAFGAAEIADRAELARIMKKICATCTRVDQIVSRYLYYSTDVDLAERTDKQRVRASDLIATLKQIASEFQVLIERSRVEIRFDEEAASMANAIVLSADTRLLEQAFVNLLDNAVKYSFNATRVFVSAAISSDGVLVISVANTGLRMTAQDIRDSLARGWRGERRAVGSPAWKRHRTVDLPDRCGCTWRTLRDYSHGRRRRNARSIEIAYSEARP